MNFGAFSLKTLVVSAGGFLGPIVLGMFDHPTGGLAVALAHNANYAEAWALTSYALHNLYDHVFGAPGTVPIPGPGGTAPTK